MHPPGRLERLFAMVLLLFSTGAFMNLFLTRSFIPTKGLPFIQDIWVAVYLVVLFFLFTESRGVWALVLKGWPFLPLLGVVVVSVVWSDAKDLTIRRSLGLLATTMAGLLSIAAVIVFFVLLRQIRLNPERGRQIVLLAILTASAGVYYTANHFKDIVEIFDRDASLSGRTTIWGASLLMGMDRLWIGH